MHTVGRVVSLSGYGRERTQPTDWALLALAVRPRVRTLHPVGVNHHICSTLLYSRALCNSIPSTSQSCVLAGRLLAKFQSTGRAHHFNHGLYPHIPGWIGILEGILERIVICSMCGSVDQTPFWPCRLPLSDNP